MTAEPAGDGSLTWSEERLLVDTEVVPVRRAVLRVETSSEQVMVPVTVTRQHARVDYVDVDPTDTAPVPRHQLLGGPGTGATSSWLVLTADEAVPATRAVPVERVRLVTDWVTGEQDVQVELSHEEISQEIAQETTTT